MHIDGFVAARVIVVVLPVRVKIHDDYELRDIEDAFLELPHASLVQGPFVNGTYAITFEESPKGDEGLVQMCKDTLECFLEDT